MNTVLFGITIVPAIVGLVEVCNDLGVPTRFTPAISVLMGVLASLAELYSARLPWIPSTVTGVALGLSACGLYAGVKTVFPQTASPAASPAASNMSQNDTKPAPLAGDRGPTSSPSDTQIVRLVEPDVQTTAPVVQTPTPEKP